MDYFIHFRPTKLETGQSWQFLVQTSLSLVYKPAPETALPALPRPSLQFFWSTMLDMLNHRSNTKCFEKINLIHDILVLYRTPNLTTYLGILFLSCNGDVLHLLYVDFTFSKKN